MPIAHIGYLEERADKKASNSNDKELCYVFWIFNKFLEAQQEEYNVFLKNIKSLFRF